MPRKCPDLMWQCGGRRCQDLQRSTVPLEEDKEDAVQWCNSQDSHEEDKEKEEDWLTKSQESMQERDLPDKD